MGREQKRSKERGGGGERRERLLANPSKEGRAENGATSKKRSAALFVVAPFSARPSRGPIFRFAGTGTGTLATKAIREWE